MNALDNEVNQDPAAQLDAFGDWLERRGRGRSAAQYSRVVTRYLEDPETYWAKITNPRYSPNYRHHLVSCLRVWARFQSDGDLLAELDDLALPAALPASTREPIERDQWFQLLDTIESADYLSEPLRLVCSIIAIRGIRAGDVVRLTKREVLAAVKTGTLSFEGKRGRRSEYNASMFADHLEGLAELEWHGAKRVRELVCPGNRLDDVCQESATRSVRAAFDKIAEDVGIDASDLYAHRFRHTYATHFLQAMDKDPEALFKLQQQMGWAKLDTAMNYLRRSRREELDQVESQLLSGRKRKKT